ncbi:MAG: hypothetical protein JXQ87_02735 [Bacteroidia bacterium]
MKGKFSFYCILGLLVSLCFTLSNCAQHNQYYTIIKYVVPSKPEYPNRVELQLGTTEADVYLPDTFQKRTIGSYIADNAVIGDTITFQIDWDSDFSVFNPDFDWFNIYLFAKNSSTGKSYRVTKTERFNIKPGRIYIFDPLSSNEVEYTGSKSERIDGGGGGLFGNGCDALQKRWTLTHVNGQKLPWKEYDDGTNYLEWKSGNISFDGTNWSSRITTQQKIGSDRDVVDVDRFGSYECQSGSGTFTLNTGVASGSFYVSGGILKTTSGGTYTLTYE